MDLITLTLIAGAILLENVWYDFQAETLNNLKNELRRAEASKLMQGTGRTLAVSLRVALTIGAAWLFTLPVAMALGGILALALASYLIFTLVAGRPEPALIGQVNASRPLALLRTLVRVEVGRDLPTILIIGVLCVGNSEAAFLGSVVGSLIVLIRSVSLPATRLPWLGYPALVLLVVLGVRMLLQDPLIILMQNLQDGAAPLSVQLFWFPLLLACIFALALLLLILAIKSENVRKGPPAFVLALIGIPIGFLTGGLYGSIHHSPGVIFVGILLTLEGGCVLLLCTFAFGCSCVSAFINWNRTHSKAGLFQFGSGTFIIGAFLLVLISVVPPFLTDQDPSLVVLRNGSFSIHSTVVLTGQYMFLTVQDIPVFSGNTVRFENETPQVQTLCLGVHQGCEGNLNGPQALQTSGLRLSPGQGVDVIFPQAGEYHITCLSPPWQDLTVQVSDSQSDDGGD